MEYVLNGKTYNTGPYDPVSNPGGLSAKTGPASPLRQDRQAQAAEWARAAFGQDHVANLEQRGLRLAEEAIEAAQACGCDPAQLHKLIDHVFARPVGSLSQEIGGVGLTLLVLAHAAGVQAEDAEKVELDRVLAKPLDHFKQRNAAKDAAGFKAKTLGG